METKLSVFCDRVIEAGWLAAVIVVPLFFNIYSSRVFEPDKLSLLRSIALVMIAAWVVRSIEGRLGRRGREPSPDDAGAVLGFLRVPMVIPTVALVGVYVLTTLTSVVPGNSFWGSYQRLQGTYTFLSYVVIFLLILNTLRFRQQLERLLTAIIVASFPVALYGIIQHFQLDPLPWAGDVTSRAASNMGNAIFLAAYLIMAAPVVVGRFITALQSFEGSDRPSEADDRRSPRLLNRLSYILLFALEALCLAYVLGYQLFFLSDGTHVAAGPTFHLLLVSSLFAALSMIFFSLFVVKMSDLPRAVWTASYVMLFVAQSLSLSYFLLLIFKLNYVVMTGSVLAEFVALAGVMFLFIVSFWFTFREGFIASHLLGVLYGFVLIIQLICIFFTKSRGPWIGLLVGLFVFVFIAGVRHRIAWLWMGAVGTALAGIFFLAVLNLPGSPLTPLREIPYVGRLGKVFETGTGTGKVRMLIWEGVLDLIGPHEPIGLPPDHLDGLNIVRSLIGYGPESMYVAYNSFYPPDLAHYEARNASPDRSHNETFDALATTGWLGFFSYMFLFGSLFYYGLKWLGFARDQLQRMIYVISWTLGAVSFAVGARLVEGSWRLSGVALAVGITIGFIAYLVVHAFFLSRDEEPSRVSAEDQILIIALFSAIVAHFIEIHFGIAVSATRTYFWIYAALLVVLGQSLWREGALEPETEIAGRRPGRIRSSRRGKRRTRTEAESSAPATGRSLWQGIPDLIPMSVMIGLVMATLGFNLITGDFNVAAKGYSVLWLLTLTWLSGGAIIMLEGRRKSSRSVGGSTVVSLLLYVLISLGVFVVFSAFHHTMVSYQPEIGSIADLLTLATLLASTIVVYYVALFGLIILAAVTLARGIRRLKTLRHWASPLILVILVVAVAAVISSTNVNIVRADIYYKHGFNWDNAQQWDASMALYGESIRLAPNQDWYYLFMARAILEKAKLVSAPEGETPFQPQTVNDFLLLTPQQVASLDADSLFNSAFLVLARARDLNPLNTDHSANLGRMFRMWAEASTDPAERQQRLEQAVTYYADATTLSPHNAQLFNEWGLVHFIEGRYDEAIAKYDQSLALDAEYAATYLLLGDAYTMLNDAEAAAEAYRQVLDITPDKVTPHVQLCAFLGQQGKLEEAVEHCVAAIELGPNNYQAHRNLAILYRDLGRFEESLTEALAARELAGADERPAWDSFIAGLEQLSR